jgi:GNAT superfamily N-acetyltransferase
VNIFDAQPDDAEQLARIKAQAARRAYRPVHGKENVERWVAEHCTAKNFSWRIGRKAYRVLVAQDQDGHAIGTVVMRRRGQRSDLSGLYVAKPGQGVGAQLMKHCEQLAREDGCTGIRYSVFRSNAPMKETMLSRGFTRAGGFRESTLDVMVDHYERPLVGVQ